MGAIEASDIAVEEWDAISPSGSPNQGTADPCTGMPKIHLKQGICTHQPARWRSVVESQQRNGAEGCYSIIGVSEWSLIINLSAGLQTISLRAENSFCLVSYSPRFTVGHFSEASKLQAITYTRHLNTARPSYEINKSMGPGPGRE